MPLNPLYVKLLEARKGLPSLRSINNFPVVRERIDQGVKTNLANGLKQHDVHSVEDKEVGLGTHKIIARVYTPDSESGPFPVLIYIHGGGFCSFSLETHDILCRHFCNKIHCVVVSVDYRLAPEAKWPLGLNDCYDCLLWVHKNAESLNVLKEKIALAGDSAGGNLATVTSLLSKERGGPHIEHELLINPWVDLSNLHTNVYPSIEEHKAGFGLDFDTLSFLLENYVSKDTDLKDYTVSPIFGPLSNLPSTTVVTAEHDMLRDEGELYAKKITRSWRAYHFEKV